MDDPAYKGIGFFLVIIILCAVVVVCGNQPSTNNTVVSQTVIQTATQESAPTIWRAAYSELGECMDTEFIPSGRITHIHGEDYTYTIIENRGNELIVENSDIKNVVLHFFKTRDECDLASSNAASK